MGTRGERLGVVRPGTGCTAGPRLGRRMLRILVALTCAGAAIALVPGSALADLWVSSSGTDTGYCSQANPCATISRAVSLAIPNATINVGAGSFRDHVTIGPSVSPLTIQGAGMQGTTVSGGFDGSGSVFTIQDKASATINDLAIVGGSADNGGGVDAPGLITLNHDVVAFNSAAGTDPRASGFGGGVYAASSQGSVIRDSAIISNRANNGGGGVANYGGEVNRSLLYQNSVSQPGGRGGGLLAGGGSVVNTTIAAN